MKYIWIAVAFVVLARIDLLLHLYDKVSGKINAPSAPQVQPADFDAPSEIISMKEDQSLKQTPRTVFFTLLEDFKLNPDRAVRENAMMVLEKHPDLLGTKHDEQFEAAVFRLRDHVFQNEPELPNFLNDMMGTVRGENLEILKRFYSLLIDENLERFLMAYPRTKDPNCIIAGITGEKFAPEIRYTLLTERDAAITAFLAREKIDPVLRLYAQSCQLVVKVELSKLPAPVQDDAEEDPANAPDSAEGAYQP